MAGSHLLCINCRQNLGSLHKKGLTQATWWSMKQKVAWPLLLTVSNLCTLLYAPLITKIRCF